MIGFKRHLPKYGDLYGDLYADWDPANRNEAQQIWQALRPSSSLSYL